MSQTQQTMQLSSCVSSGMNTFIGGYTTTPTIQVSPYLGQEDFEKLELRNQIALLQEEIRTLKAQYAEARRYQILAELEEIAKGLEG